MIILGQRKRTHAGGPWDLHVAASDLTEGPPGGLQAILVQAHGRREQVEAALGGTTMKASKLYPVSQIT